MRYPEYSAIELCGEGPSTRREDGYKFYIPFKLSISRAQKVAARRPTRLFFFYNYFH